MLSLGGLSVSGASKGSLRGLPEFSEGYLSILSCILSHSVGAQNTSSGSFGLRLKYNHLFSAGHKSVAIA